MAVNVYGVLGKQVADAVVLQLVGVADVGSDYQIGGAVERGYSVFDSVPEADAEMEKAGVRVVGTPDDLLHLPGQRQGCNG